MRVIHSFGYMPLLSFRALLLTSFEITWVISKEKGGIGLIQPKGAQTGLT